MVHPASLLRLALLAVTRTWQQERRVYSTPDAIEQTKRLLRHLANDVGPRVREEVRDLPIKLFLASVSEAFGHSGEPAQDGEAPEGGFVLQLEVVQATFIEQTRLWLMHTATAHDLVDADRIATEFLAFVAEAAATPEDEGTAPVQCRISAFSVSRRLIEGYLAFRDDASISEEDELRCLKSGLELLDQIAIVLSSCAKLRSVGHVSLVDNCGEVFETMMLSLLGIVALVLDSSCAVLSHYSAAQLVDHYGDGCLPCLLDLLSVGGGLCSSLILNALGCTVERIVLRDVEVGIALSTKVILGAMSLLHGDGHPISDRHRRDAGSPIMVTEESAYREEEKDPDLEPGAARDRLQSLAVTIVRILMWELQAAERGGMPAPINATILAKTVEELLSARSGHWDADGASGDAAHLNGQATLVQALIELRGVGVMRELLACDVER